MFQPALRHTLGAVLCITAACGAPAAPEPLPIIELAAAAEGPTVAFVAGVHGGKVAAVRAVERLRTELDGQLLRGRVLLLAPANAAGYAAGLAQLSPLDSLNLNRVFPGDSAGRPTERLAAQILRELVAQSDYLVDLHGSDGDEAVGRFAYAARPGLDPRVDSLALGLALQWGVPVIVWDDAGPRTLATSRFLQTAAHLSRVPAITVFEAGTTREDSAATEAFVLGARRVLASFGMLPAADTAGEALARRAQARGAPGSPVPLPEILPHRAITLAESDGEWSPAVRPGNRLRAGELVGTLNDSLGGRVELRATHPGIVLHQRLAGVVRSGTPLVILGVRPAP